MCVVIIHNPIVIYVDIKSVRLYIINFIGMIQFNNICYYNTSQNDIVLYRTIYNMLTQYVSNTFKYHVLVRKTVHSFRNQVLVYIPLS